MLMELAPGYILVCHKHVCCRRKKPIYTIWITEEEYDDDIYMHYEECMILYFDRGNNGKLPSTELVYITHRSSIMLICVVLVGQSTYLLKNKNGIPSKEINVFFLFFYILAITLPMFVYTNIPINS